LYVASNLSRLHNGRYLLPWMREFLADFGPAMAIVAWMFSATVRSLNHVRSLATMEEVIRSDGGKHERILHVRENRLTGLTIHLLVGLSVLLLAYLSFIPMAVLYGLFLFMGIVSLQGNQFFERVSL